MCPYVYAYYHTYTRTGFNYMDEIKRPEGIKSLSGTTTVFDPEKTYVTASSYSAKQSRVLAQTTDEVELDISFRAYERMENDSAITKVKRILLTSVLTDEIQFAPGATEETVGKEEYETYVYVMEMCERIIEGLDAPYRDTLEQLFGNSIRYGHGIAEVTYEYRMDAPNTKPTEDPETKKPKATRWDKITSFWRTQERIEAKEPGTKPLLKGEQLRLMPATIKVKPRNTTQFVVDDFMNVLGLVPINKDRANLRFDEIISREKFMVLTMNKKDEDPRGTSLYRPAFNWYNLKAQVPAEMLRFILEESVPKAVGTLPPDMPPFEYERDTNGNIIYEEDGVTPKMLTGAESFKRQIEGFRSGGGAVIPHGATLQPYKKGLTGSGDAEIFNKILKIINNEIENSVLLQTLAQSEGEHQARSASEQVAEVLYNLVFWIRWQVAMVTLIDLCSVTVKMNLGDWALRYMPIISLGDFVRRDWVSELEAIADAYFKGFIDDSQRAELMAWLNLPKAGQSRQEVNAEAVAKQDVNGQPSQPNNNRPDKQTGTKNRNDGNGTEKRNAQTTNTGIGLIDPLGHNTRWVRFHKSGLRTGGK